MAGRGMGRGGGSAGGAAFGKSNSNPAFPFNVDLIGHGVAEFSQPPPVYPPLVHPPLALESTDTDEYLLALNRDFLDYVKESPFYFQPVVIKNDIERYSDKYQTIAASQKRLANAPFDWSRLPRELHPQTSKKRKTKPLATKIKKAKVEKNVSDITNRLEELERKEAEQKDLDETDDKGEDDEEGEEKDPEEIEGQEEDIDEEMDLGTDYMNNYFDNGETYLDDDDENLEDGPIY